MISPRLLLTVDRPAFPLGAVFWLGATVVLLALFAGQTPWAGVRLAGRMVLGGLAALAAVLVAVLLVGPLFLPRDAGIGPMVLWLFAPVPAVFAYVLWALRNLLVRHEESRNQIDTPTKGGTEEPPPGA